MKSLRASLLLAACLAGLSWAVPAAGAADLSGLEVGKQAPAFSLKNQDGTAVKLADLLKQGPVALMFYRSADW